jgi:hypothetical protein
MLRILWEFIKIWYLAWRAGQSNKICGRSQIHSFKWSVQKGESFRASLNEWLGNRLCPIRKRLNWTINGLYRYNLLNHVLFRIFGVIFLYLETKFADRLFQWEDHKLDVYIFIKGLKSDWRSWVKEGRADYIMCGFG